jgi:peptidase M28-like protein/PDZ domain-containing protein
LLERLGAEATALSVGRDFSPHGGSLAAEASGEIVFVGYGVVAPERGWDDYEGVEVKDAIVLALDGAPPALADLRWSRLEKLIAARRHGARALLVVADSLTRPDATAAAVSLVSGTVTNAAADVLLAGSGKTIAQLRAAIESTRAPVSSPTGVHARIRVSLEREDHRTANVIGILPGTDPALSSEAVVLGAHYDHLGRAGGALYPGADDNASGTAIVLGLARAFAAAGGTPRTLIFILFTGEEEGLLGSAHYVRHPSVALDRTVAMLNFDMVGRLRERRLHVAGIESGAGLRAFVMSVASGTGLDLSLGDTPFAPSDHTSFYEAGTPVLFFHTEGHDDYHTPRDTADKINAAGMAQVADIAGRLVEHLGGEPRPAYVKLARPAAPAPRRSGAAGGAFLGIAVNPGLSDGVKLASVLADTAAARAGLRDGDVIIRVGDTPVNSFEDVRRALSTRKPGDAITVLYLRDGEDHRVTATLGSP